MDERPKGNLEKSNLGSVKVDNTLYVLVDGIDHRIIYPYFSKDVILTKESAQIGLWVMAQSLPRFGEGDMRIVDILRSRSFSLAEAPFEGNEEILFEKNYRRIIENRISIRSEYK